MKGVAIIASKGGVGKTTLCHLLAIGAAWRNVPAYLMHTDERDPMQVDGRPYAYVDARNPETLSTVMGSLINSDGLCVIDGGGNRPDVDQWIAEAVDLVLVPVVADTEAVNLAKETMQRLEAQGITHARYLLNMVSTNQKSFLYDSEHFYSQLEADKIAGQVRRLEAVKRLGLPDTQEPFPTPPTNVNNVARGLYRLIESTMSELHGTPEKLTASA